MKEFLSNAWVVSIISGIIVFFLTNIIIMFQNRRKHKKQIDDANTMVINRLRGYVVDNGLPQKEIINAVKSSTAREYNIKYDELLSIKELCEELITDIIGNIYVSNDNKVKYIDLLQEYLKENNKSKEYNLENNNIKIEIRGDSYIEKRKKYNSFAELLLSIIPALLATVLTIVGAFLSSSDKTEIDFNKFDIYSIFIEVVFAVMIPTMIIIVFPKLKSTVKIIRKKIKKRKK